MKRSHLLILVFLAILILLLWFNTYVSDSYNTIAILLINCLSIGTSISIMLSKKKIESKVAWTIFVLFVPIIGFVFYMILGVEYNRFKKFDRHELIDADIDRMVRKNPDEISTILKKLGPQRDIIDLIYRINHSPVTLHNKTTILTNGDEKYPRLIEELKKAEIFIHMEYFIIKEGKIFDEIKQILIEKAKKGVEVRLLYDDFGCVDFPLAIIEELKRNHIEVACFNKINLKLFRPSINFRDHRKIVVIDNKIGFTGGINISDEYAHMDSYYGFWRDTHMLIEGEAVSELNLSFIKSWYHTTGLLLKEPHYLEQYQAKNCKGAIQIVPDGPDKETSILRNTFFKLINEANHRIWIVTPYLILDPELSMALKVAALSGVDVRIIVPGKHDKGKKLIYKATEAYFGDLLNAGVKIYRYSNLFIHSKVMIIDEHIASVGTVNLDYRSLDLHFEITALLYFDPSIEKLAADYENDLKQCREVTLEEWQKRTYTQKLIESIVRIFSPLL